MITKNKVVIVGSNQLTRKYIDWDQDADFWIFNEAGSHDWVKKCDAVFQMHSPEIWRNTNNVNDKNHYEWLKNAKIDIWMQDKYSDVPYSRKYPINEICQVLLPGILRKSGEKIEYFTSSASYAIALAIYRGYKIIEIVGIEMSSDSEYKLQKDGVMFWIGYATGIGLKVIIQDKSLLFREKKYGYDGDFVIHRQRFEIVSNAIAPEAEKQKINLYDKTSRASVALENILKKLPGEDHNDLIQNIQELVDTAIKYGMVAGALSENYKYIKEVDELIKNSGGERALKSLVGENDGN